MKGGTLQITWHGSDPVLTLDFHSLSGMLATGGADHDIKFWTLHEAQEGPLPSATFYSSLSYHTAAVNVIRFSASGDQLASGADGGEILLWKLTENPEASNMWKLAKNLRFHVKDVLDLQWSSDGALLVSGSVDNTVIIWDIAKGNPQQVLKDHMHYVQGVAWDPIGQYIASISGDRTCRIYNSKPQNSKSKSQNRQNFACQSVLVKAELPKQEADATKVPPTKLNLFHDETLPSFFRRLAWSPDGSFLLVPAGIHKFPSDSVLTNTAFIVSRKDLSRPAVQLPGATKPIIAVRFCPVLFSCYSNTEQNSENDTNDRVFKLPYRLVFAVATLNSLYVYDTQSPHPLAVLAGIHYAAITDIAWSHDGKFLAVSSQDGFCTLVTFDQEELGSPLPSSEVPPYVAKVLPPPKDKVGGSRAKVNETATKVKSKGDCNGIMVKKVGNQANSTVGTEKQAQLDGEEQTQIGKMLEEQDERSNACPESPKEKILSLNNPNVEAQQSNDRHGFANSEKAVVFERDQDRDVPKKPKRITPIAISNGSSQPFNEASASLTSHATAQLQHCQEAIATSDNGPKRQRRITPVAVVSAPSQLEHHDANTSALNPGSTSQPHKESNLSSATVMEALPIQVQVNEESSGGVDVANSSGHDDRNSKDLQSSPKRPRRVTPEPIMMNCDE